MIAYAAVVPLLVCATVAATGVGAPQTTAVLTALLLLVVGVAVTEIAQRHPTPSRTTARGRARTGGEGGA